MASNHANGSSPERPESNYMPSLPPGVDPSAVDFREFFPYHPNEVKHRKRTTQAQLETLEDTFSRDKKPNGPLRAALARDLEMTPRGVQVWFQNRRAKEKSMAKKASSVKQRSEDNLNPNLNFNPPPSPLRARSSEIDAPRAPPAPGMPPPDRRGPAPTPAHPPSTIPSIQCDTFPDPHARPPQFPNDSAMLNLRRGSLPIITRSVSDYPVHNHRLMPTHDLLARRSSFDTNIVRLASHPYAHLAAQANGSSYPEKTSPRHHAGAKFHSLPGSEDQLYAHSPPQFEDRRTPIHRASMPYLYAHASPPADARPLDPAFGEVFQNQRFTSRYHEGAYTMPSRNVSGTIPGPLPAPNFSFGDSSSSPVAASPESTDFSSYAFPCQPIEGDEDEFTNSSYDLSTKFGSIASLAGSESSMTSGFYSETGSSCVSDRHDFPPDFNPDSRRPSGAMVDHFSSLGLENRPHGSPENIGGGPGDSPGGTTTYPSPGSTISSGNSPQVNSAGRLRVSSSSELALALSPASAAEAAVKQESPDDLHLASNYNGSSPMMEPANVINNGRACYEPNFQTYQHFNGQAAQYVSPYSEELPPHNAGSSSVSSPLYPLLQEPSPPPSHNFPHYNPHLAQ